MLVLAFKQYPTRPSCFSPPSPARTLPANLTAEPLTLAFNISPRHSQAKRTNEGKGESRRLTCLIHIHVPTSLYQARPIYACCFRTRFILPMQIRACLVSAPGSMQGFPLAHVRVTTWRRLFLTNEKRDQTLCGAATAHRDMMRFFNLFFYCWLGAHKYRLLLASDKRSC